LQVVGNEIDLNHRFPAASTDSTANQLVDASCMVVVVLVRPDSGAILGRKLKEIKENTLAGRSQQS
jgi:hypothetical protein